MQTLQSGMVLIGFDTAQQNIVVGIVLVLAVLQPDQIGGTQFGFSTGMRWLQLQIGDLLALVLVTAPGAASGKPPNILFLLSDDQRPDTIHALGNRHLETPNLDAMREALETK